MVSNLQIIPGIGKNIEQDLINIGITDIEALKGQDPEELYEKDCGSSGFIVDINSAFRRKII